MKIVKKNWILCCILLLAFIFRFYKIDEWLFFGMDQEYQALIAKNIVTGKHFPLIGVNASDTGMYLGPLFSYFAAIPFFIFQGNPLGWAIIASGLGVVVCFLIYRISKEMFSESVGLLASLFYAASFLTSFYDRKFWNPTFVPLFSLLLGYYLFKVSHKQKKHLLTVAFLLGLSTHIHLSLLIFIPLVFYIIYATRKQISKKILIQAIIIFLVLQSPLIIFDIRHNFLNTKAAINFLQSQVKEDANISLLEQKMNFPSTLGRFFWVPPLADLSVESGQCQSLLNLRKNAYPEGIFFVLIGIILFFWWAKNKKFIRKTNQSFFAKEIVWPIRILFGVFLLSLVYTFFYRHQTFEYYYLFLFPYLAIYLGASANFLLKKSYGKMVVFPILFLFVGLNIITLLSSYNSYSYQNKIQALTFIRTSLNQDNYKLEALGECSRFGGFRYLSDYLIGTPVSSYMDSYFGWLYPEQINKNYFPTKIILLSMIDFRGNKEEVSKWEKIKYQYLTEYDLIAFDKFGNISVYILFPKEV